MERNKRKAKKNIYTQKIDLTSLKIRNKDRNQFRQALEDIIYRGYDVEQLQDGRKIVITKPGGKFTFGQIKRNDFMVWILNPQDDTLWLISHKNIIEDLAEKGTVSPKETIKIIEALERVFEGAEPNDVLKEMRPNNPCGEIPEVLLKAYKWIWGQEDCNYPSPLKGRSMSMEGIQKLKKDILSRI